MNIKHLKSGTIWPKLALGSYGVSLGVGLYGNSRTKFSSDFIYNVTNLIKASECVNLCRNIISGCS